MDEAKKKPEHNWDLVKKYQKQDKFGKPYGTKDVHFFKFLRRADKVGAISPELKQSFTPEDLNAFGYANSMLGQGVFRKTDYGEAINVPDQMRKDIQNEKYRAERDFGEKDKEKRATCKTVYLNDERERALVNSLAEMVDINTFIHGTASQKVDAFNHLYEKDKKGIATLASKCGACSGSTRMSRRTPGVQRQIVMVFFFDLMNRIYHEAQGATDGNR